MIQKLTKCSSCGRTAVYFKSIHAGAPMLHQASYTAALRLPSHMRPPMCLQYIVMASAAATTGNDTYRHFAEPFYRRARVYAEADELKVCLSSASVFDEGEPRERGSMHSSVLRSAESNPTENRDRAAFSRHWATCSAGVLSRPSSATFTPSSPGPPPVSAAA